MKNIEDPQPPVNAWDGLSPLELRAAQDTSMAFLMAVKNYSLFPPGHVSTINLLNTLTNTIDSFLRQYGALRLDIEKNQVRYEEEVVFEELIPDNNPAFIFYRDGILWLEFLPGLKAHELLAFFRVVSRFTLAQEEPEGDLVTELWGCDFEHINYQASERLWEAEPILEFSLINPDAQAVLEYSVAAVAGFDLLKSVLGAASASGQGSGADPGGAGEPGVGAAPGEGFSGRGSLGGGPAGDGAAGGGAAGGGAAGGGAAGGGAAGGGAAGGGAAGGGAAGGGAAGGGAAGGGAAGGGAAGGGPAGSGNLSRTTSADNLDGLDFWATLRRISPAGQAQGGTERSGPDSAVRHTPSPAGGDDSGPVVSDAPEASQGRRKRSGGMAVYSATGHIPGAIGDDTPGGSGRKLHQANASDMAASGGGSAAPLSLADRKATAFSRPGRGGDWGQAGGEEDSYISVNVASIEPGQSLWQFTVEEQAELARMVREYEEGDNSVAIIELLLLLLRLEDEPLILAAILSFLKEEFRITLNGRRFDIGHALLVRLNDVVRELPPEKDWVVPLLSRFFEDIVEPEILDALTALWPELPLQKPELLKDFSALLRLLSPRAGLALVPSLAQVESGTGRRILIDMIAVFAARDLSIVENMLDRPEEDLVLRLIHVLRDVPEQWRTEPLLLKAIRHPKDHVRREAFELLLEHDSEQYGRIFQLIYDHSPAIRKMAFSYLGRERLPEVEELFLAYMTSERFMNGDDEHITNCYTTLGLCGSAHSLPSLQQVLFGQPWNFLVGIGTGVHRQGAAIALNKLRSRASLKLLGEAEYSAFSHIRKAWRKATGN